MQWADQPHHFGPGQGSGVFVLRRGWMPVERRWLEGVPDRGRAHVVDTFLVASAIGCIVIVQQYALVQLRSTAKVGALILYGPFGRFALKRGATMVIRYGLTQVKA